MGISIYFGTLEVALSTEWGIEVATSDVWRFGFLIAVR